jgi:hypothetical protein
MKKPLTISARLFTPETLQRCKLNDCSGACCTYGVWIDLLEKEKIKAHSGIIRVCMDDVSDDPEKWFEDEIEKDPFTESGWVVHTKLVWRKKPVKRKTCIFLRSDHKCALQVASEKLDKHHWFLKPFYCILHPLDINEYGEITLDETQVILTEEKSCLRYSEQLFTPIIIFEEELRYLLGYKIYDNELNNAQKVRILETNKEEEKNIQAGCYQATDYHDR